MAIPNGTIIGDKYEICAPLGEGGMGEVFHARHHALQREVALKLLKEAGAMDEKAYRRFQREAKILGTLTHQNLVKCYEFGQWNGMAYIAMELVSGASLHSKLRNNVGLAPDRVLQIAMQIASALECAHKNGVFHRDLKPDNVMLCAPESPGGSEIVKLIDFGLARLLPTEGESATKLTGTGMAVGTVMYMPPEQCTGKPADARSDIYAVGAVLYHALAGRVPFDADNPVSMMYMHMHNEPPALQRTDLPVGFENLIRTCLAKEPDDRFQSASELSEALQTVALGSGSVLPSPKFIAPKATRVGSKSEVLLSSDSSLRRAAAARKRMLLIGSSFLSVVALAGITYATLRYFQGNQEAVTQDNGETDAFGLSSAHVDLVKFFEDADTDITKYKLGRMGRSSLEPAAKIANIALATADRNHLHLEPFQLAKLQAIASYLNFELGDKPRASYNAREARVAAKDLSPEQFKLIEQYLPSSLGSIFPQLGHAEGASSPTAEIHVTANLRQAHETIADWNNQHRRTDELLSIQRNLGEDITALQRNPRSLSLETAADLYATAAAVNRILGFSDLEKLYALEARDLVPRIGDESRRTQIGKMIETRR